MTLTQEEKIALEKNCKAIRDYLIHLVIDYETDITLKVDFRRLSDGHPMGISVNKRVYSGGAKTEVRGYTGGLGIVFDGERDYNHTLAWDYTDYGIELVNQWASIKYAFLRSFKEETETKDRIKNFTI